LREALDLLADALKSGWTVVALIAAALLAVWLPDLGLPLGNSDDGRILGLFGLQARNFWDLGVVDSRFGAAVEPYVRAVYDVAPRADPPLVAVTYAHHPPLRVFMSVVSTGVLGDSVAALRVPSLLVGAATVVFMASLLRGRGLAWGPTLLAVAAMASTGFYYVYARISVSFSLLLAAIAIMIVSALLLVLLSHEAQTQRILAQQIDWVESLSVLGIVALMVGISFWVARHRRSY